MLESPGILFSFHDRPVKAYCNTPVNMHSTIGICVKYTLRAVQPDEVTAFCHKLIKENPRDFSAIVPDYLPLDTTGTHLERQFNKLINAFSISGPEHNMKCAGIVLQLISDASKKQIRRIIEAEQKYLKPGSVLHCSRAMKYISSHIDEKINEEDITELLGISAEHFSRIFRAYTGQTFTEYVNCAKLRKIMGLIADDSLTLQEAGEIVGFSDEHYLSRLFKKHLGVSFREYMTYKFKQEDSDFLKSDTWPLKY